MHFSVRSFLTVAFIATAMNFSATVNADTILASSQLLNSTPNVAIKENVGIGSTNIDVVGMHVTVTQLDPNAVGAPPVSFKALMDIHLHSVADAVHSAGTFVSQAFDGNMKIYNVATDPVNTYLKSVNLSGVLQGNGPKVLDYANFGPNSSYTSTVIPGNDLSGQIGDDIKFTGFGIGVTYHAVHDNGHWTLGDLNPSTTQGSFSADGGGLNVPEPSSFALLGFGIGAIGLAAVRRKRIS